MVVLSSFLNGEIGIRSRIHSLFKVTTAKQQNRWNAPEDNLIFGFISLNTRLNFQMLMLYNIKYFFCSYNNAIISNQMTLCRVIGPLSRPYILTF